jgi:hypothetical protein
MDQFLHHDTTQKIKVADYLAAQMSLLQQKRL